MTAAEPEESDGILFAYSLDGHGGGKELSHQEAHDWDKSDSDELLWMHLNYTGSAALTWLMEHSGIDEFIIDALTSDDPRPRSLVHHGGLLLILRGVNLNPGEDLDDMVSLRVWLHGNTIVTLRQRRIMAVEDLRKAVDLGDGPDSLGDFIEDLTDKLTFRVGSVVLDLDEAADALEDEMLTDDSHVLRKKIADIRRTSIHLRRYLAPQRDVMTRLYSEKVAWLDDTKRNRIREIADRTTRYVEDLDSIRERATVTQEELNNRNAEQMNNAMYVLSMISGIFLPLGLLTGLFGINLAGIPGAENPWSFAIFCVALVIIAVFQVFLFKKKRWM